MNEQTKVWIDGATYQQLLSKWRFAALGNPCFQGDTGKYYSKIMLEKKQTVDHVQASKNVGWDN